MGVSEIRATLFVVLIIRILLFIGYIIVGSPTFGNSRIRDRQWGSRLEGVGFGPAGRVGGFRGLGV